jgi:hypothetical protein
MNLNWRARTAEKKILWKCEPTFRNRKVLGGEGNDKD